MRSIPVHLLRLGLPLGLSLFVGCGSEDGTQPAAGSLSAGTDDTTPALPLPEVDLEAMEEAPRRQLETLRQQLQGDGLDVADRWGELGRAYHAYDRFDAAEVCYRNAMRLATDDSSWIYYLGLLQVADGRLEEARESLETVARAEPGNLPARLRLGRVLLELGRNDEAERAFREALALEPESAAANDGLGRSLTTDPAAARDHFLRALAQEPEATALHYRLSQVERRLGNLEAAERHLRAVRAAGIDRGSEVSFADPRSDAVARLRLDTAFAVVEALARDPERISAASLVGYARAQFGSLEGAVAAFERYVAAERGASGEVDRRQRARIHLALGVLHRVEKREAAARPELEQALTLAPDLAPARLQLAASLNATGNSSAALEQIRLGLERAPDDPGLRSLHADLLAGAGRFEEAASELERLLQEQPGDGEALLRLGMLEAERGRLDRAAENLRRALEEGHRLTPERRGLAARSLAQLEGSRGEYAAAAAAFRLAVEVDPESPGAWLGEGTALILAGEHRQARERLELALDRHPLQPDLTRTLARHLAACPDRSARDGRRAIALIEPLLGAGGGSLADRETHAMALAEAGELEVAAELQRRLLDEAAAGGAEADLPRLGRHLRLYEQGRACCGE